ncbi:MAG: hypothetical protein ACK5MY_12835 [Jhaorihella sp.]
MRTVIALLAVALVLTVGASAWALLHACGLRLPFGFAVLSFCEADAARGIRAQLALAGDETGDLMARIAVLERDLARLECRADPPPPPPPPAPPPERPPVPETPSGLDPGAFDESDISVMAGCWLLSSDYAVREINTGEITRFRYWRICFDKNGNGTETMRSTNGVVCTGTLTGRMPGNGRLTMREPSNLQCDNRSSIFRRDITCRLDARGNAQCDTYQPETNGRSAATLRRAGR